MTRLEELLPIRDHRGYTRALTAVNSIELSADDVEGLEFVTTLNTAMDQYLKYCAATDERPKPDRLVAYLLNDVLNCSAEDVRKGTGVDLTGLLNKGQSLTADEVATLSSYFQVDPEDLQS